MRPLNTVSPPLVSGPGSLIGEPGPPGTGGGSLVTTVDPGMINALGTTDGALVGSDGATPGGIIRTALLVTNTEITASVPTEDLESITLAPIGGGLDDGPQILTAWNTGKNIYRVAGTWKFDGFARVLPQLGPCGKNGKSYAQLSLECEISTDGLTFVQATKPRQIIRILLVGDSRVVGNTRAGWRRPLWQALRKSGVECEFLGHVAFSPNFDGYAYELQDPRHSGVNGDHWSDMTTAIAARVAVSGQPDIVLVDLGTNDLLAHTVIATTQAATLAGIAAIRTQCPLAQIIAGTCNTFPSDAVAEALRVIYNPWLLALDGTQPGLTVIDDSGSLTTAELADGIHPNPAGASIQADIKHDAIVRVVPELVGQITPRPLLSRSPQASVNIAGATDYSLAANTTCGMEAAKSYMCSFWHAPTTLDTTLRSMVMYGADYTDGWAIFQGVGGGVKYIGVYNQVGVVFQDPVPWITTNNWMHVVVGFFLRYSASDPRPCCALWIDGRLIDVEPVAAWPDSTPAKWIQWGYFPAMGVATSTGLYDSIRVCKSSTLYFDAARQLVERDYYDGAPLPDAVAHYQCDEGVGLTNSDKFGGAVANMIGASVIWAPVGTIVKPCDGVSLDVWQRIANVISPTTAGDAIDESSASKLTTPGSITLSPLGGGADDGNNIRAALLTGKMLICAAGSWLVDGVAIVTTTAMPYCGGLALLQSLWYLSPTGSDTDTGATVGHPLATWAELRRRMAGGVLKASNNVYPAAGTYAEDMICDWGHDGSDTNQVHTLVYGTRTAFGADQTLTAGTVDWVPPSSGAATYGYVEVAGVDLTTRIGKQFQIIGGARDGGVGWLVSLKAHAGNDWAYYLPVNDPNTGVQGVLPQSGDVLRFYDLPQFTGRIECQKTAAYLQAMFVKADNSAHASQSVFCLDGGTMVLWGCHIKGAFAAQRAGYLKMMANRLDFTTGLLTSYGAFTTDDFGNWYEHGGLAISSGGQLDLTGCRIFTGTTTAYIVISQHAGFWSLTLGGQAWSCWMGVTSTALGLQNGATGICTTDMWGTSTVATAAIYCTGASKLLVDALTRLAVTGATNDAEVGATFYHYAELPVIDAGHGCQITVG